MSDPPETVETFKVHDSVRSCGYSDFHGRYVYGSAVLVTRITKTLIVCADGSRWRVKDAREAGNAYGKWLVHDTQQVRDFIRTRNYLRQSKQILSDHGNLPENVINAAADVIRAHLAQKEQANG